MVCLLLPSETGCNTAGINWSCMILHLPCHHRRKLPETEGLLAALIVTTKQRLLRNADRARCETHVILRFFRFYPTYFSLRAINSFATRSWWPSPLRYGCLQLRPQRIWSPTSPTPLLVPASMSVLLFLSSPSTQSPSSPLAPPASFLEIPESFLRRDPPSRICTIQRR